MPAVTVVIAAVASYTGVTAAISATLVELGASALVASVGTGAIIGAGSGAISAAVQGGDIAKGALIGGVTGGVGGGISNVIGGALSSPGVGEYGPQLATGSPALDAGLQRGITNFATGGLGAGLAGGNVLRGALLGGVSGGISGAAGTALELGGTGTSALGGALSTGLGAAFPEKQKAQTRGASTQMAYQPTASGKPTPGSSAVLGNALSIAPGMGYSPSSTVFGASESDKPKSNVWNVESLKGGAEVGPNVS